MTEYKPTSDKIVHVTYADLSARNIIRPVHLVQYDSGIPILAVKLYNDGQVYTVPKEANVNIRYNKADGKKVYNPSLGKDSDGHTVYFEMTQQMTAVCGETIFIVEIEKNNEIASSGSISIIIDRNPIQEENIRSSNEYITAKQYAEQAVDAAAESASSASQAAKYANTASSKANDASTSAANAISAANNAANSMQNARDYAASAEKLNNTASAAAVSASTSATNAKKSETAASQYASLARSAYEEILGADVGKFGLQLANEHSVLQPIYDSSENNICDSSGSEIQGQIIFADESEVTFLRNQVSNLETFIARIIGRLDYVTDHALLDSEYKGL